MRSGWPTRINPPVLRVGSRGSNSLTAIQPIAAIHDALRGSSNLTLHHKNGITFSNLAGYFTTRVDLFGDAPQQIDDQLNLLFGAYYAYIYENLYHNLVNITAIPNEITEVYFISNKNTKQIAVYSKLPEKDASIAYYD